MSRHYFPMIFLLVGLGFPVHADELDLVAAINPTDVNIHFIEGLHILNQEPDTMLYTTRQDGATCGGGTPLAVWQLDLISGGSRFIQTLPLIQEHRGALFESSTGTLFTGGGWCGPKPPYFSVDYGETWQPATRGTHPPNSTFAFVEFNGDVYAGTGYAPYHAQLYKWLGASTLNQWELVFDVPPPRTIIPKDGLVVFDDELFVGTRIYGGMDNCDATIAAYRSSDGINFRTTAGIPSCHSVFNFSVVSGHLIARTQNTLNNEWELFIWDGEQQQWRFWVLYPLGIAGMEFRFFIGVDDKLLAFGQAPGEARGVYQSTDLGQTWTLLAPLTSAQFAGMMLHNHTLYLSTYEDSEGTAYIYRLPIANDLRIEPRNRSRAASWYRHPTSRGNVGVDMTPAPGIDARTKLHGRNRNGLEAGAESATERGSQGGAGGREGGGSSWK